MGKKANTFWFMLAATAVNVIIMILLFTLGFFLETLLLTKFPALAENAIASFLLVVLLFGGSIGLSLVIYNKLLKWAQVKFKLEENLYPFLAPRGSRPTKKD